METAKPVLLVLCKTLRKGGAEKQAMIAAKLLSREGFSVTIIIWNGAKMDEDNLKYLEGQRINCIGLQGSLYRKIIDFRKYVIQLGITIILSYLTLANLIGAIAGRYKKSLITVGGIRSERLPFIKFLVERYVHNRFNDCTVFNSYAAMDGFVHRGFNPAKAFVIHNAAMIQTYTEIPHDNAIRIITVSRFVKSKDFTTALKSFRALVVKYPDRMIRFLIIGYGKYEKQIRRLVSDYDLETRVDMLIDPPDLRDLLARSDIYLSTSLVEGLSNSIMEAMAAGLPVVATNVGDNRYLIEDSQNGYIVPCKSSDIITQRLEQLILSEDLRKRFGDNSQLKISAEFTEEIMLDNYKKLIEALNSEAVEFIEQGESSSAQSCF